MTTTTMMTYSTAASLAQFVYRQLSGITNQMGNPVAGWRTEPDGCETITWHGWTLRIADDGDGYAPHAMSWYLDSPNGESRESGGWQRLPEPLSRNTSYRLSEMLLNFAGVDSFDAWLDAIDLALADSGESRDKLPYQLHQWWDIWDASVAPEEAVVVALITQPGNNAPWPQHAAYKTN